jgi:hypothetical protein
MASESSILSAVKSEQVSNSQTIFFPLKQARSIKDAKSSIGEITSPITVNYSVGKSASRSKSVEKIAGQNLENPQPKIQPETNNNEKKLKHKKQKTKHKKHHKKAHQTKESKRTRKSSHTTGANLTDVFTDIDSMHDEIQYVPAILPTSRVLSSLNSYRPISGTLRSGRNRSSPLTAASSFTIGMRKY